MKILAMALLTFLAAAGFAPGLSAAPAAPASAAATSPAPDNNRAKLKGKSLLVFCGYGEGYVHKNIRASAEMFIRLGKRHGFRVDTTSQTAVFTDARLSGYDAVAYANASYVDLTADQQAAFQRFIRRGGGFVGIHAAICTNNKWHWFTQMIGGYFAFHPPLQEFTLRVIDGAHPSTAGMPVRRQVTDELYINIALNPSARVLAVSEFGGVNWGKNTAPDTFDGCYPAIWCNEFEGGRVWYSILGHDEANYSDPRFVAHIVGGLEWVMAKKK